MWDIEVIKLWAMKNIKIVFLSLCGNIQNQYVEANFWCLVVSTVKHQEKEAGSV